MLDCIDVILQYLFIILHIFLFFLYKSSNDYVL